MNQQLLFNMQLAETLERSRKAKEQKYSIKPMPKRMPLTKSGRLLCAITQRLILKVSNDYIANGVVNREDLWHINSLIDRISKRLNRESEKLFPQSRIFQNFTVTFIKPNRKRKQIEVVAASTKRRAYKIIRQRYGKQTQIIY